MEQGREERDARTADLKLPRKQEASQKRVPALCYFDAMQAWLRGGVPALLIALFLVLAPASPGVSQENLESDRAPISAEGALYLVRSTLIALHQANDTGNYTVLRDLGAPAFRSTNTSAQLGDIFSSLRDVSLDLTGVALVSPVFTRPARMSDAGLLHLVGEVDAAGTAVIFEMLFQPVEGTWRLFGLSVRPRVATTDGTETAAPDEDARR